MLIRMPKTILMSEPCGMENLKKKKFPMFQDSNPVLHCNSLVHYINLFSKTFPNLGKVLYTYKKNFRKKARKSRKWQSFYLQKSRISKHTYVNINVTVPIGFHCCFDFMTLTLST